VKQIGSAVEFSFDSNKLTRGEADEMGIGIAGIAKRGKELKVYPQGNLTLTMSANESVKQGLLEYLDAFHEAV